MEEGGEALHEHHDADREEGEEGEDREEDQPAVPTGYEGPV